MHWKCRNFIYFKNSFASKLNDDSIHNHMHSPVDVPLDIDWPAGEPEGGIYLAQGLH